MMFTVNWSTLHLSFGKCDIVCQIVEITDWSYYTVLFKVYHLKRLKDTDKTKKNHVKIKILKFTA